MSANGIFAMNTTLLNLYNVVFKVGWVLAGIYAKRGWESARVSDPGIDSSTGVSTQLTHNVATTFLKITIPKTEFNFTWYLPLWKRNKTHANSNFLIKRVILIPIGPISLVKVKLSTKHDKCALDKWAAQFVCATLWWSVNYTEVYLQGSYNTTV